MCHMFNFFESDIAFVVINLFPDFNALSLANIRLKFFTPSKS